MIWIENIFKQKKSNIYIYIYFLVYFRMENKPERKPKIYCIRNHIDDQISRKHLSKFE